MKAHQRIIREREAETSPRAIVGLSTAEVRPISFAEAKTIILRYEWLGNMGTSEIAFGLFLQGELAGVACFGACYGSKNKVAGAKWADRTTMLIRGACAHWAHPHAASFLITAACKKLGEGGWRTWRGACRKPSIIFYANSDVEAGEIGTVYQACGWMYGGQQKAATKFEDPKDGKIKDIGMIKRKIQDRVGRKYDLPTCGHVSIINGVKAGCVQREPYRCLTCCDTGRGYFERDGTKYYFGDKLPDGKPIVGSNVYPQIQIMPRAQMVAKLRKSGAFSKNRLGKKLKANPKHFYVGIYTDKRTRRLIMKDLRFTPLAYPKRVASVCGTRLAPPITDGSNPSARSKSGGSHEHNETALVHQQQSS